ncbi:MAG TPA: DUF4431 domain-containing protein [Chlamydiales bacterium]|nr:DUF4431 domain-containing protein [Chlamydiales bacterium]
MRILFVIFLYCFNPLASQEWSGALQATLHGKLVRKHFHAPRVVENPPFGWFMELDSSSEKQIINLFKELSPEEQMLFDDVDLKSVRLAVHRSGLRAWCQNHCNEVVVVEGEIREPEFFKELRCFYFDPQEVEPPITQEETSRDFRAFDDGCWESSTTHWTEDDFLDESLVLPEDELERLVSLTGELRLHILNGVPEQESIEVEGFPYYSWIVELHPESFEIACHTPVRASFQSPGTIRSSPHCHEMALTGNYDQDWLCDHLNQTVTVSGYLWHAHTGHHPTPIMMDSEPWDRPAKDPAKD